MYEPTEREVDQDVHKSIEMFERAMVPSVVSVTPQAPQRLLVALDGSSQDEMSLLVAERLIGRFGCAVAVLDAREWSEDNALAKSAAQRLDGTALARSDGDDAYDQILSASDQTGSDLVIVPSPFGRDIEKVGADSTGTVIDVLLARSRVPLLVIRTPYDVAEQPFQRVVLSFAAENSSAPQAANWAVGLTAPQGTLRLLLVVAEEAVENFRSLMQALHEGMNVESEQFGEALQKVFVPLHTGLQQAARERGLNYRLDVRHEGHVPLEELTSDQRHPLLVLGLEREDNLSQGYVHDRVRHSANAVLVVPRS